MEVMDSYARAARTISGETEVHEECGGDPCNDAKHTADEIEKT